MLSRVSTSTRTGWGLNLELSDLDLRMKFLFPVRQLQGSDRGPLLRSEEEQHWVKMKALSDPQVLADRRALLQENRDLRAERIKASLE